jgi:hypothetical protein
LPDDDYGNYEYAKLDNFTAYFLQAFRNSIGDLATPAYDFWLRMAKKQNKAALVMIYIIWMFWLS